MGRSCTKDALASLDKVRGKLCKGNTSNVYRLDMGDGEIKQFHFEDWVEYADGGLALDIIEHGTNEKLTDVRIGADGSLEGGHPHLAFWSMALRDEPILDDLVLTPIE